MDNCGRFTSANSQIVNRLFVGWWVGFGALGKIKCGVLELDSA